MRIKFLSVSCVQLGERCTVAFPTLVQAATLTGEEEGKLALEEELCGARGCAREVERPRLGELFEIQGMRHQDRVQLPDDADAPERVRKVALCVGAGRAVLASPVQRKVLAQRDDGALLGVQELATRILVPTGEAEAAGEGVFRLAVLCICAVAQRE